MNELYQLLVNIQEIVKANNIFLNAIEEHLNAIEKKLTIDTSGPNIPGTENNDIQ